MALRRERYLVLIYIVARNVTWTYIQSPLNSVRLGNFKPLSSIFQELPLWAQKPPKRNPELDSRSSEQVSEFHPAFTSQFRIPGLPRTGTASFSTALSNLLNGPVYHGGTQILVNNTNIPIKTWIDILAHTTPADREYIWITWRGSFRWIN